MSVTRCAVCRGAERPVVLPGGRVVFVCDACESSVVPVVAVRAPVSEPEERATADGAWRRKNLEKARPKCWTPSVRRRAGRTWARTAALKRAARRAAGA